MKACLMKDWLFLYITWSWVTQCRQSHLAIVWATVHSTVSGIIYNNCDALWDSLQPHYMPKPSSSAAWKHVSEGFEHAWNFLHCVGAIDGKHIVMQAPAHSGSTFYNYKGTHSIVFLAVCEVHYCFTLVDIGYAGQHRPWREVCCYYQTRKQCMA